MSKAKAKGTRAENEVVRLLNEAGISAKRQPMSGALKDYKGDVVLPDGDAFEVKNRESIAEYLWTWLAQGDAKYLVLRKNHHDPLVLLKFDDLIELLRIKQEYGQIREGGIQ